MLRSRTRQFEAAVSRAGVTKGGNWGEECAAEKEKEKGKELAKDGSSGLKREVDARARGGPAAARQPDVLSAPTVPQRKAKQREPPVSQQAPLRQQTLYRAPWRLPLLTHPLLRVAVMMGSMEYIMTRRQHFLPILHSLHPTVTYMDMIIYNNVNISPLTLFRL